MKIANLGVIFLTALVFASCSSSPQARRPAGVTFAQAVPRDLSDAAKQFRSWVNGPLFNPDTCAQGLSEIYDSFYRLTPDYFDREKLKGNALEVSREFWMARMELRKKFAEWVKQSGLVQTQCVDAVRRAFLMSRFLEEYVAEWKLAPPAPNPKALRPAWSGDGEPWILRSPALGDAPIEFKSGDVLMSRGNAFTSAAIARVGDVDGGFSHLAVVYIDEKTKEKYTVEAHIEVGVVVLPFEKYFTDGKVRSVLFRYPDAAVAHQAAKIVYDRAKAATAAGANIPYDFAFDPEDDHEVFCAEIVDIAFRQASGGKMRLPLFPSKMSAKNRDFLNDIGMSVQQTFAPMDMDVDPRFELLAEWRDLARTHDVHKKDAALTRMFEWMETYDYVLVKSAWTRFSAKVLRTLRRWPIFSDLLHDRLPTNMSARTVAATFVLGDAAGALYEAVGEVDSAHHSSTHEWLTPYQMGQELDRFREKDLKTWQTWKAWFEKNQYTGNSEKDPEPPKAKLHDYFRARKLL